jgi:hypothetical protein
MRFYDPPVFGRIEKDEYLLDFRTIRADEIESIAQALKSSFEQIRD